MNLLWLPAQVFVVALVGSPEAEVAPAAPVVEAAPALEVVRIKRDFGKPHVDMAIDAWTDDKAGRLDATRLWWVDTSDADRRKPLGRLIERMVHLQYRRISGGVITVVVAGDGKEFTFTVERGGDGKVHAFVPVDVDDGGHVARCRIDSARLMARRVLNVPIGIARIAVTCSDGANVVRGQVRHREV